MHMNSLLAATLRLPVERRLEEIAQEKAELEKFLATLPTVDSQFSGEANVAKPQPSLKLTAAEEEKFGHLPLEVREQRVRQSRKMKANLKKKKKEQEQTATVEGGGASASEPEAVDLSETVPVTSEELAQIEEGDSVLGAVIE